MNPEFQLPKPDRPPVRPFISLRDGKVCHNSATGLSDKPTRVVFTRELISVGCSDITVEAARFLLSEYDRVFTPREQYTLQP